MAHTPSPALMWPSTSTPRRPGSTPTFSRPIPSAPGRDQQPVAAQVIALGELEHVLAVIHSHGGRVLTEAELYALGAERLAEGVAERLRLTRQKVVLALDERNRRAHAVHRLGHLHTDRSTAQHDHAARHLGEGGDLPIGPNSLGFREPRDRRDHRVGAGGEDDLAGAVLGAVHSHPAGTDDPRRTAQQVDALAVEPPDLAGVVVPGDHEVAPLEGGLRVQPVRDRLARAGRLASRLERLAGAQQRLRGDAGVVVALAAHPLALDYRDPKATLGEVPGAVLAGGAGADDDHVVVHLVTSGRPRGPCRSRTPPRSGRC